MNSQLSKSILLIEDDSETRDALACFLTAKGCTVATAANGMEALEYLRQFPPPDLILLDLLMPVMDGYAFREEQQRDARLARIPVVVLSAASADAQRGDLLGDVGYLCKPVDSDLLLDAIERFSVREKPVVLVVDDERAVGQMLEVSLRDYGFAVRRATNGRPAVDIFREHHSSIALVLLDVQMAGMDGPATLAALQRIKPDLKCCFMSGSTGGYSAQALLDMGAARVFTKPFVSLNLFNRQLWNLAATN